MAIIDCPACGKHVSREAEACIHCGHPLQDRARRRSEPNRSSRRDSAMLVEARIANEKKSTGIAYALWLFLGGLGIHNLYLGRLLLFAVQLACFLLGPLGLILGLLGIALSAPDPQGSGANETGLALGSLSFVTGIVAGLVLGVTLLVDLFTIPSAVDKHTEALRRRYARQR
jgi:TM2 domain-containing membrane protein YozV/ribosomal protein L37E